MDSVNCCVHFLTLKQIGYEESNVAVTFYHDRTHFDEKQKNLYAEYAEDFNLQQGRHFVLHNRIATVPNKMSKLKDQVKEFDSLLSSGVKLIKILWLNNNRLILVTESSTLIMLLIDPTSGDLIKILIDKTLEGLKLTSKKLSDLEFICPEGSKSPTLVVSYSDKSKIDLIKFKKSGPFLEFYKKSSSLEKLESFDPSIGLSFEFTCPEVGYFINKNILVDFKSEFFTLWWSNQTEFVSQRSLLDRDDLRNNILVLSSNLNDPNLFEYMYKSDGLLLLVDYMDEGLISIEQIEYLNNQRYSISIFKCVTNDSKMDDFKPVKMKLKSFNTKSRVSSVKVLGGFASILCEDQTIYLFEYNRNLVHKSRISGGYFDRLEWLVENLSFCAVNQNGDLKVFDIGLNEIDLKYKTRQFIKFKTLSRYLNENLFVPNGSNRLEIFSSSRKSWSNLTTCFTFTKGPFGLFKLDLTIDSNPLNLINFYLKSYPFDLNYVTKSINLYESLDWNRCPIECLGGLQKVLNLLLSGRVKFNNDVEDLCERVLGAFYRPKKEIKQDLIIEYRSKVVLYSRKYFYVLLKNLRFEKALRLADDIGNKDLFNDLFYCANDRKEYQLAEVCRIKFHELKNLESKEKLRNELNRSVNTVDDNLKGNYSEFDRYSVSSSEQSSSIESYYGSIGSGLNELLESESEIKLKKKDVKVNTKNGKPRVYTEEDIENFARNMIQENKFIYELAFN